MKIFNIHERKRFFQKIWNEENGLELIAIKYLSKLYLVVELVFLIDSVNNNKFSNRKLLNEFKLFLQIHRKTNKKAEIFEAIKKSQNEQ